MDKGIKVSNLTDLQLASFSMRANVELQRAVQNVQLFAVEIERREKLAEEKKQEPKEEVKESELPVVDK